MKPSKCITLFDVDNTLLNNDRLVKDLRRHLRRSFGTASERRYFEIFEDLRSELGYTDYLGALQRYRLEHPGDPYLLRMSSYLIDYPFAKRLYPGALETIRDCRRQGPVVILSDGDAVFQPQKIIKSGLWKAVNGNVLIFIHKEKMLADVERLYPAPHYVMVDDKLRILAAMKKIWKTRLTTVFIRQGHYARDSHAIKQYAPADITISHIHQLMNALKKRAA
jgi:FMN phosphatase YigB (HAD superfamily)